MAVLMGATKDKKAIALGNFYISANNFVEKYKIGGNQKLQKIVGENLFFKRANIWYWKNRDIAKMTITQLNKLTSKLK
jgi:hypothetical protein